MYCFQTLCRLQMHKAVSEQMAADAAFIDPLFLAHPDPQPSEGSEEVETMPRSIAFFGSKDCPGDQAPQVRKHEKEKTACLSQ